LLAIAVYGYATGIFSSRKLERATYDSVAFRFIAAGIHPDHDTLATFRRRFIGELQALFVQVLELAKEMKLLKLGTVCLDGTKIRANASRHSALSNGHIEKLEVQQRELMTHHGVNFTELGADEIHDLEPKLNRQAYTRGLFQPGSGFVNYPRGLVEAYFQGALQRQARFVQENVLEISASQSAGVSVRTDAATHRFDKVVVATGAWSGQFAAQVGDKVCLDTERGYHISLKSAGGPLLTRPVGFPARDCVISPMHDGITVCSGDELAGLSAAPDFRRIRSLQPFVRSVLPESAALSLQREWIGYRPSTPDSLPVIGPSAHNKNVIYAFGHGHLGLTLSGITAELVKVMVKGDTAPFDLTPYRINRF
jgi:D-amino-acid dehydrogenase